MPRVPQNMRERAIGMLQAGMRTVEIAKQLGTSKGKLDASRKVQYHWRSQGLTEKRTSPRNNTHPRSLHSDVTLEGPILNCLCDSTKHTRHSQQSNKWPNCDQSH